ncbi:hypothetical protein [Corynebacterium sp. sy039]|uniref:hypothetical protein n=1 Tax=Corynebacterium sp. sy039 TaxID=2599641 RepID=UPI0011B5671E|nr:hypothetical protein [Corynebacterium sp. sy039]QDZ41965.1 hypothetical protein FQV43_01370 [Corynebacterium sp. sy039]
MVEKQHGRKVPQAITDEDDIPPGNPDVSFENTPSSVYLEDTKDKQSSKPAHSHNANQSEPLVRPKSFTEYLDYSKLQFGQKLIAWCIFLICLLSVISHFWNSGEISAAIELLKLVTTTALGFVFAKTQDQPKENSPRQENVGEKLSIG